MSSDRGSGSDARGPLVVPGYVNTMVPVDEGRTLAGLVRMTLYNIEQFNKVAMDGETVTIGNTTVDLTHKETYRKRFATSLLDIAVRKGWTKSQFDTIVALFKKCPPDRLYRVRGGFHSLRTGQSPLGIIVAYQPIRGAPANAGVAFLGFKHPEVGCVQTPFGVPAEGLQDVTDAALSGSLPELRSGG